MKIRPSNIRNRGPWFVECARCGRIIDGKSPEEVVEIANNLKWEYREEEDLIFCSQCYWGEEVK